ncbi:MAG: ABC transporter ATP-binding protein [Clostridiales bacterium]|nr:ABC transporter ATP-binding protein [Clostridiales bacterium]
MLLIDGLCKTYENYGNSGRLEVLDHIDMKAETGEFVSIIGPSGCGKSTIFNLLCGIEEKSEGIVTIDGCPAKPASFSYMQQRDLLMDWKRIWENISLPLKLRGVSKKDAKKIIEKQSELYGLSGFENAWPIELSGGMRQRAAFFRTMLSEGNIMLLDEPFASIDALNRERLQEWLMDVLSREKRTVLLVTHSVDEAIFLSDRVYVLTERPAKVKCCFDISFDRPRKRELLTAPEFNELKAALLSNLT